MCAATASPDHDQLFAIAESQDGYFTMAQALEAGFARSTHSYHVRMGNWLREHRGIYRLRQYPRSGNEQLGFSGRYGPGIEAGCRRACIRTTRRCLCANCPMRTLQSST